VRCGDILQPAIKKVLPLSEAFTAFAFLCEDFSTNHFYFSPAHVNFRIYLILKNGTSHNYQEQPHLSANVEY